MSTSRKKLTEFNNNTITVCTASSASINYTQEPQQPWDAGQQQRFERLASMSVKSSGCTRTIREAEQARSARSNEAGGRAVAAVFKISGD